MTHTPSDKESGCCPKCRYDYDPTGCIDADCHCHEKHVQEETTYDRISRFNDEMAQKYADKMNAAPIQGKRSGACQDGNHTTCAMVGCSCDCHGPVASSGKGWEEDVELAKVVGDKIAEMIRKAYIAHDVVPLVEFMKALHKEGAMDERQRIAVAVGELRKQENNGRGLIEQMRGLVDAGFNEAINAVLKVVRGE